MKTVICAALKTAVLGAGLLAVQAKALVFVTESQLAANDLVDWGQFGSAFATVANGSLAVSANALSLTVSTSNATSMERRDQSFGGWAGNFAPGDKLLWNQNGGGDLVFDFAAPIFGAGTQVQNDFYGAFVGSISAYAGNTLLGSFGFSGNSTSNADNTSPFAGVYDASGTITRVVVSVTGSNSFAINELRVNGSGSSVPDTATTLPLLGFAALLVAGLRRKFGCA